MTSSFIDTKYSPLAPFLCADHFVVSTRLRLIIWFADEVFAVKGEQKQSVAKVLLTSRVLACRGGVIVGVVLIKVCVALICGRCSPARETINTPTRRRSVCLRQCGEVVLPSGRLRVCVCVACRDSTHDINGYCRGC